jgi:arabinose-5-phosphate isomerase
LEGKLLPVEAIMRKGEENPVANEDTTVADALKIMTDTKGNPGAVNIIDYKQQTGRVLYGWRP